MGIIELFILAVGLSMDAFAVSVCKGLSVGKVKPIHSITAGIYFGGFQTLMPAVGYLLGIRFQSMINEIDHWAAFVLLVIIGLNMIKESKSNEEEKLDASFDFRTMLPLAVATSIDALAVGVTFAFLDAAIVPAVMFIGVITFIFSAAGIKIGSVFGARYKSKSEFFGGFVLICIGIKILFEHL